MNILIIVKSKFKKLGEKVDHILGLPSHKSNNSS